VAFCGDTCIDVLEREEWARKAKILVLEVTFLDDRVSVQSARENGHVHLDEVIQRPELFENEHILFTHFSSRYTNKDIVRILDERLPEGLKQRAQPLLFAPPWARV
jgi:ribonuclease Z